MSKYSELYAKCGRENKTCSCCRYLYADPMVKDIPVDEEPPQCMNRNNKLQDGNIQLVHVMPWDTCGYWEYYLDENGNTLSWGYNEI